MAETSIHTLIMMVRGFSNEVTVNGLASKLGISYSTLARCKNGIWPRSITFDAMHTVFDGCRDDFFKGDADALVISALRYLDRHHIETSKLAAVHEAEGYEGFITALLVSARAYGGEAATSKGSAESDLGSIGSAIGEPKAAVFDFAEAEAATSEGLESPVSGADAGGSRQRDARYGAIAALPVTTILLIGLLNVPLVDMVTWASANFGLFCVIALALAVMPVVVGVLVDVPLAWHAFHVDNPDVHRTWEGWRLVAKYGGIDRPIEGAGRFDLSRSHLVYQASCNVLGALCTISVLGFVSSLPGFLVFFATREWAEFFKVGVAVGFYVAYSHNREHRRLPHCEQIGDAVNPDAYLPSRAHVWANAVHLVFTFSAICILVLGLLAYSVASLRVYPAPLLILWPYAHTIAFLAYEGISPDARKAQALGAGSFMPGVAASSVGIILLVLVCYRLTWHSIVICLICSVCLACCSAWSRSLAGKGFAIWIRRGRLSGVYSVAVVAAVAVMLVIGLATTALP